MSAMAAKAFDSARLSDRQNTYAPITAKTTVTRTTVKRTLKVTKCWGANLLTRPSPKIHASPRMVNNSAQQMKLVSEGIMLYSLPLRAFRLGMTPKTTNQTTNAISAPHTTSSRHSVFWVAFKTKSVRRVAPTITHNPILRTSLILFILFTVNDHTSTQTQTSFFFTSTKPPRTVMLCLPS